MIPFYEYDIALVAASGGEDERAAHAVLEALNANTSNETQGTLKALVDIYETPIDKEQLKKLVGCRAIVLLCSPCSITSTEVAKRLACFVKLNRQKNIIPLLIQGDAIPLCCSAENGGMGLAADLRANGAWDFHERLQSALPGICAQLGINERHINQNHGALVPINELPAQLPAVISRDKAYKKHKSVNTKAFIALSALCLALICLFIVLLGVRGSLRYKNDIADDARVNLSKVYRSLAGIAGDDAAGAVVLYKQSVDCLLPIREHPYVNIELVANLRALGDSLLSINDYEAADEAYMDMCERALYQYELTGGKGALEALCVSQRHYASALMQWGDYDSAQSYTNMALKHAQALSGDGADANAMTVLADTCAQLGEIMSRMGDPDAAREALTQALVYRTQLCKDEDRASMQTLAKTYYSLARNELLAGDYDAARRHFDQCLIHYAPAAGALGGEALSNYLTLSALHAILFYGDLTKAVSDAGEAEAYAQSDSFTKSVYAMAVMLNNNDKESLALFNALIDSGESAQIQNGFELLSRVGRSHPVMDEINARLSKTRASF